MDLLNLELDKLKPYVIDAYTHVYGSEYHDIIEHKINNALYLTYIDIRGLEEYINNLLAYKKYKLAIYFLEQIGYDVSKYKNLNLDELSSDINLNEILKKYFGFIDSIFDEEKYSKCSYPVRLFNFTDTNNDWKNHSIFKSKISFINFLRVGCEEINENNYFDFINTKEYSNLLDKIKEYTDIYDKLKQEFIQYKSSFSKYEEYIKNDENRKDIILMDGMDYTYNELLSVIPLELKERLEKLSKEEVYKMFFDISWNSKLNYDSLVQSFDKEYMEELFSSENSLFKKAVLASDQIEYLQIFNIEPPVFDIGKDNLSCFHTEQDVFNYLNFLKSDEIRNLIPQQDLIDSIKRMCDENYENYEKKYYTTRIDFINMIVKCNSNHDLDNFLIDKIKNKRVCISLGGANSSNGYHSLMFYTIRVFDYGFLDRTFLHENGHIVDDNPNGSGFEFLCDANNSCEHNKYDKSYRKYERFNENINDMFTIEAKEYLRKKEIYLIEEKKYVNNEWNNRNTGLVTKNILRPLLERYRSVVIDAKINGDRNILSSYIGDYNFEELIDIVNKVDYLWKRGLDYKLNNDKDNEDVIEYYKQLERVKEIYKNIDAFVAANNEIKSVKK